ncbi:hypothetical protein AVEN_69387-1 [Araneus ventricosus]|uniref:Uncharacterized protein n=1 Tax=Araneus ventricosus TaxID=182803 RepID=A0A4Y1ZUE8_ARAVE|nr:hypothetical protein AVEN_69387-1 [Araneus ventricosus]
MTRPTPELAPPLQASAPHQREDFWPPTFDLTRSRPTYTADLQWNLVSNLESSGPRFRDLTTRPPRPVITAKVKYRAIAVKRTMSNL